MITLPEDLGCGATPHINGWIAKFFPYIVNGEQEHRTNWDEQIQYKDISAGKNEVFITWKHLGNNIYLLLSTGFWGVTIDPKTKRLRTIRGYALTKDKD